MSDHHNEIVIVKRHGGDHDDHHGGAWKIAFADFMTAMMAFFLVMWLIAANDKTRATVARYFNPVKLVDATVRKKGLFDPKVDDATSMGRNDEKSGGPSNDKSPGKPANEAPKSRETRLDATMRSNPLAALAEIAGAQRAADGPPKDTLNGAAPVIGRQGGPAFRDPFAPPPPPPSKDADAEDKDDDPMTLLSPPPVARSATPPAKAATAGAAKPEDSKTDDSKSEDAKQEPSKADAKTQKKDDDLTKLVTSLKTSGNPGDGPDIKVRKTSEGYLVSLTDTTDFSMFANASAVPSRRVIQMMERIAKVLASKPGGVVVRGYTDNKPFRSGRYDNWNLSVDRAQAAHYMLVRGGLDDSRIAGVAGFADHGSSPGIDPSSPLNRRIEILLKDEGK